MFELVKYLLGSKNYKVSHSKAIENWLRQFNSDVIYINLEKLNLLLPFIVAVKKGDIKFDLPGRFYEYYSQQEYIASLYRDELFSLSSLIGNHCQVVILKGISFNIRYYDSNYLYRKCSDIDLLIESDEQADRFVELTQNVGYDYCKVLDNYVHGVSVRSIEVDESKFSPMLPCSRFADGRFEIKLDIHKRLFLLKNGQLALDKEHLSPFGEFGSFNALNSAANLVLVSTKIWTDINLYYQGKKTYVKFFKLIMDYVRILEATPEEEFEKSVEYANKVGTSFEFLFALKLVEELVPECHIVGNNVMSFIDIHLKMLIDRALCDN